MLTVERGAKSTKGSAGKDFKSSKSMATKFTPPTHPAIIVTSAFTAPHIEKLKQKLEQHFIPYGMQTSKKKVNRPLGMPKDKNFIITDDSAGSPILEGEFLGLKMCRVDYPIKNNLNDVIKKFDKYIGLGKQTVEQESNFEESAFENYEQEEQKQKMMKMLDKKNPGRDELAKLTSRAELDDIDNIMQAKNKIDDIRDLLKNKSKSVLEESQFQSRAKNKSDQLGNLDQGIQINSKKRALFMLLTNRESQKYMNYLEKFRNCKNKRIIIIRSLEEYYRYCYGQKQGQNCLLLSPNVAFKQLHKFRNLKDVYIYGDDPKFCSELIKGNIKRAATNPKQLDSILGQQGFDKNQPKQFVQPIRVGSPTRDDPSEEKPSLLQRFKNLFTSKSKEKKPKSQQKPKQKQQLKRQQKQQQSNSSHSPSKQKQKQKKKVQKLDRNKKQKQPSLAISARDKDGVSLGRIIMEIAKKDQPKQQDSYGSQRTGRSNKKITKISRKRPSKQQKFEPRPQEQYNIVTKPPNEQVQISNNKQIKPKQKAINKNGKNVARSNQDMKVQFCKQQEKSESSENEANFRNQQPNKIKLNHNRNVQTNIQERQHQNNFLYELQPKAIVEKRSPKFQSLDENYQLANKNNVFKQNPKVTLKNKIMKPQFHQEEDPTKNQKLWQASSNYNFEQEKKKAYLLANRMQQKQLKDKLNQQGIKNNIYFSNQTLADHPNPQLKVYSHNLCNTASILHDDPKNQEIKRDPVNNFQRQNRQPLSPLRNSIINQVFHSQPPQINPPIQYKPGQLNTYQPPVFKDLPDQTHIQMGNYPKHPMRMPFDESKYDRVIENGVVVYRPKFIPVTHVVPQVKTISNISTLAMSPIKNKVILEQVKQSPIQGTTSTFYHTLSNKNPSFSTYEYFMNRDQLPVCSNSPTSRVCSTQRKKSNKSVHDRPIESESDQACHYCNCYFENVTRTVHKKRKIQKQNKCQMHQCNQISHKLTKTREAFENNLSSDNQRVDDYKIKHKSKSMQKSRDPLSSILDNCTVGHDRTATKNYTVLYLVHSKMQPQIMKQLFELSDESDTIQTFSLPDKVVEIVQKGKNIFDIILVFMPRQLSYLITTLRIKGLYHAIYESQCSQSNLKGSSITLKRLIDLPQILCNIRSQNPNKVRKQAGLRIGYIYFKDFNRPVRTMAKMLKTHYPQSQTRKYFSLMDLPTKLPNLFGELTVVLLDEVSFNQIMSYCQQQQKQNPNLLLICIPKSSQSMKMCQKRPGVEKVVWLTERELEDESFLIKRIQKRLR